MFAMRFNGYPFTALRPLEELRGSSLWTWIIKLKIPIRRELLQWQ